MDFFAHLYRHDPLSDANIKCSIKNYFIGQIKGIYLDIMLRGIFDSLNGVDFSKSLEETQEDLLITCF